MGTSGRSAESISMGNWVGISVRLASHVVSCSLRNGLSPVRPRVALLLVLLPVQSLDAKAL